MLDFLLEEEYEKLYNKKKEIEKRLEEIKKSLTHGLKEESIKGEKLEVVWTKETTIFNSKQFSIDQPELYEKYQKPKKGFFSIKLLKKLEG